MKTLTAKPSGWPCKLQECPPGHFSHGDMVGFKSEYGGCEAFNEAGEYFWGGVTTDEERAALIVTPIEFEWQEGE